MNLKNLEATLSRLADSSILGNAEREALNCARDVVGVLRAANDLPPDYNSNDLPDLALRKSNLPEAPQAIIRLPSSELAEYDRYAVLPADINLADALAAANEAIRQANQEDHDAEGGGCADGECVESNVRRRLMDLGFSFLSVESTHNWDEYVPQEAQHD